MTMKFGPAGVNTSFATDKKNKMIMFPEYLSRAGLDAYEYQCGHGVRIKRESAEEFGKECLINKITTSIHAPYYISLSSLEEEKREKSVQYVLQAAVIAKAMGAKRIIVHSGSCAKISRVEALELAKNTLGKIMDALKQNLLGDIIVCPEVMGKSNQLGTVEEVVELCKLDDNLIPCIDFGHLNARLFGAMKTKQDYESVFTMIKSQLGIYKMKNIHIHFSKIEYSIPGGEKRHLTFEDDYYGPNFEPLADILIKKSCTPIIICESAGTQVEDAVTMRKYINNMS